MKPSHIGKYEIQRRLGTGGMGSLYLARDPGLERFVAIKVLKDEFEDDREIRERFTREARSVARLRHRNIIVVYEIGEHERRPFMAMEYIAGETLTEFLRRVPTPPLGKRLSLIEDLCDGLAHAHATGIIHRDVKPANIMLDAEGVLKILDFGIARLGNSGMTQDGMMMGTVNYMSPEQIVGRGVDHRTDVFATGAVLYEAIALTQAFPGRIDTGVLHCILNEGPLPLAQHVPDVDPELAGIVEHALERDPERRYQDLRDLQKDLVRVRRRIDAGQQSRTMPSRLRTDDSPVERRGLDPERGAKLRRQQVEENLRFGEEAFARGDHDAALHHAERAAAMVDPDNPAPADLIDKARFAIEAKVVRHLLTEAEQLLAEGHPEDAAALVKRASSTLPDLHGATELRNEIRLVSEKVAAAREREQRISVSLERARTSMERGGFETALRAVYEVLAIDPERPEARELEQEAKSRLEAQREHERARRSAYDRLKSARALADAGRFDEAAEAIRAVTPPSETVRIAAADALAAVREQQRQAAHAAIVAEARVAFERGELEQALAIVDSIPAEEQSNEARGLRATIDGEIKRRRELEQKRQALEDALASGQSLLEAGELARAFERVEDAAKLGLADERIPAMRHRIAELGIAAQERRRQEARDRTAAKMVDSARRLLANGDGYAAIALLERAGSDHELVVTALHEIRAAVAEQEERVRQEAERRRREEDARLRAEREAARQAEEERKAAERQRLEAERRRQEEEARHRAEREAARQLEEERRAAERQRQEAEHRRQEEEARHRAELEAARQAEEERAAARQLEEERKAAERQRQEIERRRQEEEARHRAEREAARQLEEERKAAERQRQEEQRRREAEHRRQLEEAEARELDAQAATLVAQARGLFGSGQLEEAVTLLRGAPAHTLTRETLAELDSRRIAIERQRARESRQRARQQRRAAARATLHHAAADRRVHLAGVAILVAAVAGTVWQLWPASPLNDGPSSSTTVAGVPPIPVPPTGGDPGAPQPQTTPPAGAIPGGAPSSGAPASGAPLSGSTPGAAPASAAPPVPIVPPAGGRRTEPPAIAPPAGRSGGAASPVAVPPAAGPTGNPPSVTPPPSEAPQLLPPPVAVPPPAPNPTPAEPPVAVQPNPPPVKPDVPPPVSNVEQDRAAIDQLLNEYIAAYSRMDETRVRALDPTFQRIQGRELMKSVTLVLPQRSITVSPDGQSAVLTATGSYNYVWNRSGFPPSNPARLTWNLRKQGTTWTVVR